VDIFTSVFLTTALVGVVGRERSASRSDYLSSRDGAHDTHWIGGWSDHRNGLGVMEKRKFLALPVLELNISAV
jgi:hypothetical protein